MNDKKTKSQKNSTTSGIKNHPSLLAAAPSIISTDESIIPTKSGTTMGDPETRANLEGITFVCLDLPFLSNANLFGTLRGINDHMRVFTDPSLCLDCIRASNDTIFFISSSSDSDLIAAVHAYTTVEAIFILNPDAQMNNNDFPKLAGVFNQHEELFMVLEDMLTWFEQVNLEVFAFENDKVFLWSQLWKEERMSLKKVTSNKNELVDMAQNYYRGNAKALKLVDTFYRSYRASDALRWCFRSPFPLRSLHHALRSHNIEQLGLYSFLLNDASRVLKQQPKRTSTIQLFKGMKLSNDLVDNLEQHVGGLVCAGGFLVCTKSRTTALTLASSPSRRADLLSVLFKVDCDTSVPFAALSADAASVQIVFDVYTSFRVMCVNRGQMSVVKMKTACEEGGQMAGEYKKNCKGENIQILLDDLLTTQKPATPPPPPITVASVEVSSSTVSKDEIEAQEHLMRGEIDLALAAYRRIEPVSSRILNRLGQIYTEKKDDNELALKCHTQALTIQEENGEDISETLTSLGIVHHNRHEFDLALSCHRRALKLRDAAQSPDPLLIATNLRGIANAHWARRELPEAVETAQRVLIIHQSLTPVNKTNVATSLATLANIYHDSDDDVRALELGTRALVLLERSEPANSSKLGALLHNLAAFQLGLGALADARSSFEKALNIYTSILPPKHPKRVAIENHLQSITQMEKKTVTENHSE